MSRQQPPIPDSEAGNTCERGRPAESLTDLIDRIQRDAFQRSHPRRGGGRYDGTDVTSAGSEAPGTS